jgi:hypothetical protein
LQWDLIQEDPMRRNILIAGITFALSVGMANAQTSTPTGQNNPPADQKQQQNGPPPAEARPVPGPRLPTQPPGQEADNAKPTMLQPNQSAMPDRVNEPVPGATRQTEPSNVSAANAAQDKLPILAMQFPLTDEQKQKIAASLGIAKDQRAASVQVTVAQSLPNNDISLQEFSADAKAAVPGLGRYKYVQLNDRILIIDPPFWTVVGDIKK